MDEYGERDDVARDRRARRPWRGSRRAWPGVAPTGHEDGSNRPSSCSASRASTRWPQRVTHHGTRFDRGERFADAIRFVVGGDRRVSSPPRPRRTAGHGERGRAPARHLLDDLLDRITPDADAVGATWASTSRQPGRPRVERRPPAPRPPRRRTPRGHPADARRPHVPPPRPLNRSSWTDPSRRSAPAARPSPGDARGPHPRCPRCRSLAGGGLGGLCSARASPARRCPVVCRTRPAPILR